MDIKQELGNELLCHTCLSVGRNIYKVTSENIKKYYYDILDEVPLNKSKPFENLLVCLECRVALKKCWGFRQQVQDSYRILQTYTAENLKEYILSSASTLHRLTIHHNQHIDILGGSKKETETIVVKVENDWEYDSDRLKDEPGTDAIHELECEPETVQYPLGNEENKRNSPLYDKAEETMEDIGTYTIIGQKDTANSSPSLIKIEDDCPLSDIKRTMNSSIDWTNTNDLSENLSSEHRNESSDNFESELVCSTDEDDIELIQKTSTRKKKVKNLKLEKEPKKMLTINLTYDEMLMEREKELKSITYLNSVYKCQTCVIGFTQSNSYKKHMNTKHSTALGEYACPICKTIISSVDSFTAHYKRHMRRYECTICQKRTTNVQVMHKHYYLNHEISLKQYNCNICGKISDSIDTHRYHTDSHKARVQCPDCDKTFRHRAGLLNHRIAVHERVVNKYPCEECGKTFRWKNSLNRHKETHQVKLKDVSTFPYCSLCGINFASVSSYHRHMKNSLKHVTQNQLRYICDHCNRRFSDKTKLRDHIEEKHLHMSYNCHICTKPYKNRIGLDQHIRNVHKGRPKNKMCHHCGRGFTTKAQLESHIRSHTGERPFICEYCPTTFSQQSNLAKHYRQVHLKCKKPCDDTQQVGKVAVLHDRSTADVQDDTYRPLAVQYSPTRQTEYLEY